jgi:hypothetical protein
MREHLPRGEVGNEEASAPEGIVPPANEAVLRNRERALGRRRAVARTEHRDSLEPSQALAPELVRERSRLAEELCRERLEPEHREGSRLLARAHEGAGELDPQRRVLGGRAEGAFEGSDRLVGQGRLLLDISAPSSSILSVEHAKVTRGQAHTVEDSTSLPRCASWAGGESFLTGNRTFGWEPFDRIAEAYDEEVTTQRVTSKPVIIILPLVNMTQV